MRILVTGGTGFIGGYFVPMLLKEGHQVRLLVRNEAKARKQFGDKCEYHVGDVTNKDSLKGCCEGIDIVFHLVTKSSNELFSKENFDAFRKIYVSGTQNIVSECGEIKKFIYVSSTVAIGLVKDNQITEKNKCNPYLPYQITKFEVEELIRKKCKEGFPGIIVCPTKVYGINEANYSYLTLAKLVKKGMFFKIGNGHNYTSNVYVSDFAQSLVKLVNGGVIGETYIATSDESIDFIESGRIVAEELGVKLRVIKVPTRIMVFTATIEEKIFMMAGKKPVVTKRNIMMTIQDRVYDISKIKQDVGYKPQVSMEQGIRAVIRWYKEKELI